MDEEVRERLDNLQLQINQLAHDHQEQLHKLFDHIASILKREIGENPLPDSASS